MKKNETSLEGISFKRKIRKCEFRTDSDWSYPTGDGLEGVRREAAVSGAWLEFVDFGLRTGYSLLATDQCNEDNSFWFIGSLHILGFG